MDAWVSSQNTNGSWTDLKYGTLTTVTGSNTSDNHVLRLWNLAAVCSKVGHAKYNNAAYKDAVKRGLEYWYNSKTIDPNWWYNKIYFPQTLGEILMYMREFDGFIPKVTSTGIDEPEILTLFQPQTINDITINGTGANAIDIGLHYVYRGILTQNSSLLESTRNRLELLLTENIQDDLVFHDHGPQIQISSYGWVFANGIVELASYLVGTPAAFNLSSENFAKVVSFIRETQISSVRGSSWDFSVMGRAISRNNAMNAGMNYLQKMADLIDPANATTYLDALNRLKGNKTADYNVKGFNKHYWSSDYTQHARKGYLFAVRNVSMRTVEAETGNGENLKANYFSHGATFISVDGNEYKNIMPYWDWSMIPGTTFPNTTVFPTRTTWGTIYGKTAFVGGVSDGENGASVLDFSYKTTKAKKSWFFFDNEIVCLGAGITDNGGLNVRTTVNQAKMETPSYSVDKGGSTERMQTVSSTTYSNTNLAYLRNGKVAYFFPNQGNVKYSMKSQSGAWRDINLDGSATIESGYVFSLWFDHGVNPTNALYSYIVVPGIDTPEKAAAYDATAIEIISNTSDIQAVINKKINNLQIIFHKAGTLTYGDMSVTVNQPCAFMLKAGTFVTVSDPAQANSLISVSIVNKGVEYKKLISLNTTVGMTGTSITTDFQIPTGNMVTTELKGIKIWTDTSAVAMQGIHISSDLSKSLHYEIHNLNGQLFESNVFEGQKTVSTQSFPSGIYLVSVSDGNRKYNQRIIKR
jgi:chondroitin AC lyase